MKQFFLTAFACLFFLIDSQSQTYQDTTFTDPVVISFAPDFVTFENCRFVGIEGVALTLEGTGALISNCRFENIEGTAVYALASEVYLVDDTIRNVTGFGVQGNLGAVIILGCEISAVSETAVSLLETDVSEISECKVFDVGGGIYCRGIAGVSEAIMVKNEIQRVSGTTPAPEGGNAIVATGLLSLKVTECKIDSCLFSGIVLGGSDPSTSIESADIQRNIVSRTNLDGIIGNSNVLNGILINNEVSHTHFLGSILGEEPNAINWFGPDARLERNHIHDLPNTDGDAISLHSSATVVRNLIQSCAGNGIHYRCDAPAGTGPLSVYNNIVSDVIAHPLVYDGFSFTPNQSEPINTVIRNNTLHSTQSPPLAIYENDNFIAAAGNILIFEGEADTTQYIFIDVLATLTESLNLKSSGDLGFVDFAGRDFHLASEASAAHNALPLNFGLPNDDFDGDLRLGLRDAGADELSLEEIICGCNNCPNEIPDLFFGDFTFAVVAADNNDLSTSVQGVCGVRVEFDHEYIGDVSMELISPAGQSVQLVGPSGFFGSTNMTTWNVGFVPCGFPTSPDPGFSAVWNNNQTWGEAATYTGIYYPAGGCLEDFNTGTVTGDWTLRVFDNQVEDNGTVRGFEVMFCNDNGVSCFLCSEPPTTVFTATPAGAWGASIVSLTTGSVTNYVIDYGDGQTASGTSFPSFHLYENAGTYVVRLIATNDCGSDTLSQIVQIAGALPVAFAYAEPNAGCAPLTVQVVVTSADHVDSWHWFFPGGAPSESFDPAPTVTYAVPGEYFATLIVENEVGTNNLVDIFSVLVQPGLTNASYELQVMGDSIVCTNFTQNALSFYWTLDGGSPLGTDTSPFVFEVDSSGDYTVGLTVLGICDTVSFTETISVVIVSTQNLEDAGWKFALSPNPNDGQFRLNISAQENLPARVSILNTLGMEVHREKIQVVKGENLIPFDLKHLPAGVYHLQIQTEKGWANLRVVIG